MVLNLTSGQTWWIAVALVIGVVIYKFIVLPLANEGKPIDPPETPDQY